jgi:hypothetical protein
MCVCLCACEKNAMVEQDGVAGGVPAETKYTHATRASRGCKGSAPVGAREHAQRLVQDRQGFD